LLGCRVANFGVGGYGTDQAFLRYAQNDKDGASIILLVHQSENILRNINQYRDLLYRGTGLSFKPRFVPDGSDLRHVPVPMPNQNQFAVLTADPGTYLPYEYFLPDGESGLVHFRFPYTFAVLKAFGNYHVQATLRGYLRYEPFYQVDHPARGLQTTAGILRAFAREATARDQVGVVVLLPNALDHKFFQDHQRWPYMPLIEQFAGEKNLILVNLGPLLAARVGDGDPCALTRRCNAHYNAAGYQLVADAMLEALGDAP
jgi:hypothetical protein